MNEIWDEAPTGGGAHKREAGTGLGTGEGIVAADPQDGGGQKRDGGRRVGDPFVPEQPTERVRRFFGPAFADIREFTRMLEEEGELRGLVGPREMERLWSRHIVNSAAVLEFLPRHGQVLDIGSGSGLPGIIIAICRPDLDVHLAEPMLRRCEWLSDVIDALGLDNVTLHQARAEELRGKGKADVVTARAVANMSKLVRMTSKLIAPGGALVALKGRRAAIEVEDAAPELKRHHLTARIHEVASVMDEESTYVVVCTRI
ncbi:16S rRNA (guanine(527)-N(7))-methyltransferase RsmG [Actinomyces sp. B33]|uniref:16S rRNA (guanine(527)-N(7))-methyltransferase RsmG n=1 Tax=Actinomyces sp. B33 TaxID=2942131 RepID=UPI00234030DD|nr:16S rRNA (guanine(527)-N(7))-methyltransferase RsmG [Actinomyces sp. B33]MDC4232539.1 16S rRNA (guanine(527)-N(7))-methyltransferase RsmG [Actinomyces sp. B33]